MNRRTVLLFVGVLAFLLVFAGGWLVRSQLPEPTGRPTSTPSPSVSPSASLSLSPCGLDPDEPFPRVTAAPDSTLNTLFTRSDSGWTGGNLAPSVRLSDGRTVWMFSDSYLGGIRQDRSRDPASKLVRNLLVVQAGNELRTLQGGTPEQPAALVSPPDASSWYGLGYGLVEGEKLRVLAVKYHKTGPGMFDVERSGTGVATFSLPTLQIEAVTPVAPTQDVTYTYGSAILQEPDYTYIYADEHRSGFSHFTYVARAPHGNLLGQWEFYTDKGWSTDPKAATSVFDGKISSVVKHGNRYLAITTSQKYIVAYQSCTPVGPWRNPLPLYMTTEKYPAQGEDKLNPDDAIAHPDLSGEGDELLISYHLGFFFPPQGYVFSSADIGRPRFVRVRISPGETVTQATPPATGGLVSATPCALQSGSPLTVAPAEPDERFNRLFKRSDAGWTGGDGARSVSLPDGRSAWLFGDTNLGGVAAGGSPASPFFAIRNSIAVQKGDELTTLFSMSNGKPSDLVPPPEGFPSSLAWYWLGDGTVEGDKLHVIAAKFRQVETGAWGFNGTGTSIATFALPGLSLQSVMPLTLGNHVSYDSFLEESDYTYIYGSEDVPGGAPTMHVARAKAGYLLGPWEFYTGKGWSSDPKLSKGVFTGPVSSVFKFDSRYVLLTMTYPFGDQILAYQACSPIGPWVGRTQVYTTPESKQNLFTYIPAAHPEFTQDGQILISYSVNGQGTANDAANYRPRFIRVKLLK